MITNSSFYFLRCTILVVVVRFCLHFRTRTYCFECAVRMLRLGYLF